MRLNSSLKRILGGANAEGKKGANLPPSHPEKGRRTKKEGGKDLRGAAGVKATKLQRLL